MWIVAVARVFTDMAPDEPTPVFPGLHAEGARPGPGAAVQERVIVGIDGSAEAHAALRWALRYARRTGAQVEAIAAWQFPLPQLGAPGDAGALMVSPEDVEAEARRWLDEAAGGADMHPDGGVQLITVGGDPVDVLLDRAAGAALIVLGNKGHGALAAAVLGSVAQRCVHHARCPVVLVPPAAK
jgi:nucleotide-binding universal stress UspA family protein